HGVGAVDRRGRRVYQVLNVGVPTALEDRREPSEVAVDVRERILEGVPNASLSGEMDDSIEPLALEERRDGVSIREIRAGKPKAGARRQLRQARLFERDVVILVQ